MAKLWKSIENRIQERFHISEPEWVQVDVSKRGKIHVTVVSDQYISKGDVREIIADEIQYSGQEYYIGFINVYSVERAAEMALKKTHKSDSYMSWADVLYADADVDKEASELEVISFYSYKGGVGRTIALIETAYNLAKAGKRVMLLDLDIEAPSLHNIFSDRVNDGFVGVQYGIIEYLYKTVVQGMSDVSVDDIYCSLQMSDISGEIFLIPAVKKINKEYIYQIDRLQTEKVQERQVFDGVFRYVRDNLHVDTILVDTRAGFNAWGSLSLLSLSNQVIFVAYPNAENIEGLNIAFEMLNNIGKKRYAVAMSQVVSTDEGVRRARELFSELDIEQEELIPVYYREEIAVSKSFPIISEEILSAYEELSDYILDNERIRMNRIFLQENGRKRLLKNLFYPERRLTQLGGTARFSTSRADVLLKYAGEEDIFGLKDTREMDVSGKNRILYQVPTYTFFDKYRNPYYASILTKNWENIDKMAVHLIARTICNTSIKDEFDFEVFDENTPLGEVEQKLNCGSVSKYVLLFEELKEKQEFDVFANLTIIIEITEDMLSEAKSTVLDHLKYLITSVNRQMERIQFKFVIKDTLWEKYKPEFSYVRGNTREVRASKMDIERFLSRNIQEGHFEAYEKIMRAWYSPYFDMPQALSPRMREEKAYMDLILGVRKNIKTYSRSMTDYLCDWLKENPGYSYCELLDILKEAVEEELKKPDLNYSDRLISFTNLQRVLNRRRENGNKEISGAV